MQSLLSATWAPTHGLSATRRWIPLSQTRPTRSSPLPTPCWEGTVGTEWVGELWPVGAVAVAALVLKAYRTHTPFQKTHSETSHPAPNMGQTCTPQPNMEACQWSSRLSKD